MLNLKYVCLLDAKVLMSHQSLSQAMTDKPAKREVALPGLGLRPTYRTL